ncbi:MAG: ligase-associated DNA damage response exonuclease [Chitinophagaceae bacterium]
MNKLPNWFVPLVMPLIEFTDKGLYCREGNFYIDPWRPVEKAVITHGHSDHAKAGSQSYLCHHYTKPILQLRLGDYPYETIGWNERIRMNNVTVSLHPAGHIIGSSQVRVEYKGEVWVVSGDYKLEDDGISGVFEPVRCNSFISESTFGLPIYQWKPQRLIFEDMADWISQNKAHGKTSVLIAYSLGKAQRILMGLKETISNIFVHGAIWNMQETLLAAGWDLPPVQRLTPDTPKDAYKGSVVIAPPGADGSPWMKKFSPYAVGICSGWMQVRGNARRRNVDAGFVMSDHADFKGLIEAVKATGAETIYLTHGFQAAFSRYLTDIGFDAREVKTEYGGEEEESLASAEPLTENVTEND